MKAFLVLASACVALSVSQAAPYCRDDSVILLQDVGAKLTRHTAGTSDGTAHMLGVHQLRTRELYADFFALHGLTLAQADELVRLIAQETVLVSHWSTGSANHVPTDADHQLAAGLRERVANLLGRERYGALMQYRETLNERAQLHKLTNWLRIADQPLGVEQKEQLVAVMVSERYRRDASLLRFHPQTEEYPAELMSLLDTYDDHVLTLFEAVLTPAQREIANRQFAERSEQRQEALARYHRARAEGDEIPFNYPAD